jgi:hypothetical protein
MAAMSHDQFRRISERAHDAQRRTFTSGTEINAQPVDFGQLRADLKAHGAPGAQGLLGLFGRISSMLGGLTGGVAMGPGGPIRFGGKAPSPELQSPPTEDQIAEAERRIGHALPEELRQLYAIADGGFGPGGGLFSLRELVSRYRELTKEPYGPLGQDWPANLLPIFDEDPVLICIDLESGRIVAWDPEEIEDEERDEDWQRSFIPQQASLAALMDEWLGAPTLEEESTRILDEAHEKLRTAKKSPVTGWPIQLDDINDQIEAEITALGYSPELRAEYGLPETGWEDEVRRRYEQL